MSNWNDKKIEKLKQLWDKGMPTAEIGKKLGFSKNAIVGKVHRLGLSNRNSPIKTSVAKIKKDVSKSVDIKKEKLVKVKSEISETSSKKSLKEKVLQSKNESQKTNLEKSKGDSLVKGVPLVELTLDRCCWPIDNPNSDDFTFCGKKVFKNKPYCLEHCLVAYTNSANSAEEKEQAGK